MKKSGKNWVVASHHLFSSFDSRKNTFVYCRPAWGDQYHWFSVFTPQQRNQTEKLSQGDLPNCVTAYASSYCTHWNDCSKRRFSTQKASPNLLKKKTQNTVSKRELKFQLHLVALSASREAIANQKHNSRPVKLQTEKHK